VGILFMTGLGNNETADNLQLLMPKEKIICYDAFSSKFAKLVTLSRHYSSLFLHRKKAVNVFQFSVRWMSKKIWGQRAINIFINHGWGTKKSPGNLESLDKKTIKAWRRLRKNTDYVICNSDFDASYFMRHELLDDLPFPKFVPIGHPRNDFLVSNACNVTLIGKERRKLGIPEGYRVFLFAPTHREKDEFNARFLDLCFSEIEKLDRCFSDNRIILLFRPHYSSADIRGHKFQNVRIAASRDFPDPRPLMLASDVLVTDYSSIYVDYLLLQRPIIFYQKDVAFFQEIRGLVVDPENPLHMPGPKIDRLSDILDVGERDFMKYDLNASRSFFHNHYDDRATERLANFLTDILAKR